MVAGATVAGRVSLFETSSLLVLRLSGAIVVRETSPARNVDGVGCARAVEEPMRFSGALVALGVGSAGCVVALSGLGEIIPAGWVAFGKGTAIFFRFFFQFLGAVLPPVHAAADEAGPWWLAVALPTLAGVFTNVDAGVVVIGGGFSCGEQGVIDCPLDGEELRGEVMVPCVEKMFVNGTEGSEHGRGGLILPGRGPIVHVEGVWCVGVGGVVGSGGALAFAFVPSRGDGGLGLNRDGVG